MRRRDLLKYVGVTAIAAAMPEIEACLGRRQTLQSAVFNQVGFLAHGQKRATVPARDNSDNSFQILSDQQQHPVWNGSLGTPIEDAASGDRVAVADFSAWTTPGTYRLAVAGQTSKAFAIGNSVGNGNGIGVGSGVYREPLRLTMRAFYGQRCGCAVDLGGGYKHPACHMAGAFHASSGRSGALANHGGWHDAGDYGRYVVNSGISTATLLWAWELYPGALRTLALAIPESGGKTPDVLAEIRWNIEWMLSLQDSDGGVWHKQTSEQFCAFIMPEKDTLTSYVIGTGAAPYKSTCATADLAAVAAIAARCYGPYDQAFAARCLAAAQHAFAWAAANPNVTFKNPPGIGTGEYGDAHCADEILWAAAELWRTTGDAQYEQAFFSGAASLPPETAIQAPGWANLAPMAYWTYALADRKGSPEKGYPELRDRILEQTVAAAGALIERRNASGYGNTLQLSDYRWGSNSDAANQSLLLLVANQLQPDPQAVEAALGNLHYLFGRNCFGVSWVTQVGTNPFQHPHHRPSASDGIAAPWPGLLSGGPNARPADRFAMFVPTQPPMRMWTDEQGAYSMNEVAINWNAPLVFLLAAANSL
jgi:endoglucanase